MNNGKKLFIMAIVLIICGIVVSVIGLLPPAELKVGNEIDLNNLDPNYAYHLEDMELFGEYASMSGENGAGSYYIGLIETANSDFYLFSVYVDNSKEWKREAREHNFTNINLSVPACYSCVKVSVLDDDLERYYTDFTDELIANSVGLNVVDTGLHLRYVCDEPADYDEAAPVKSYRDGGIFMLVIGAGFLLLGFFLQKKARKAERKAQLQFEALHGVPSATRDVDYRGPEF